MKAEKRIENLKEHIRTEVEVFFSSYTPEESCLILDSTGMAATKHYLVLSAIGLDRLHRMREIHAFSGGAFAYFGFHGLLQGQTNHPVSHISGREAEAAIRAFHHPSGLGPLRAMRGLLREKTAFGSSAPLEAMVDFLFTPELLEKRLTDFPPNLTLYLGVKGEAAPIGVSVESLPRLGELEGRLRELSIRSLMTLASTVPFVYGRRERGDDFFDAAFTPGYRSTLKRIIKENPVTLVSTPWRESKRGSVTFINCYGYSNSKRRMKLDFMRLLLNLPNRDWGRDIAAAFPEQQPSG